MAKQKQEHIQTLRESIKSTEEKLYDLTQYKGYLNAMIDALGCDSRDRIFSSDVKEGVQKQFLEAKFQAEKIIDDEIVTLDFAKFQNESELRELTNEPPIDP